MFCVDFGETLAKLWNLSKSAASLILPIRVNATKKRIITHRTTTTSLVSTRLWKLPSSQCAPGVKRRVVSISYVPTRFPADLPGDLLRYLCSARSGVGCQPNQEPERHPSRATPVCTRTKIKKIKRAQRSHSDATTPQAGSAVGYSKGDLTDCTTMSLEMNGFSLRRYRSLQHNVTVVKKLHRL